MEKVKEKIGEKVSQMNEINSELISVIIPVYNGEQYLSRCLESIFKQTYKNIEVIVVDDCSPGNLDGILGRYKRKGMNLKILRNKCNEGPFRSRINGMKIANGRYIGFMDSDDEISIDYYRCLVSKAQEKAADIVVASIHEFYEDTQEEWIFNLAPLSSRDIDYNHKQGLEAFMEQEGSFYDWHVMWNKIYSFELIKKSLKYLDRISDHITMCDDLLTSVVFYLHAQRICNVPQVFYRYYKTVSSVTRINDDTDTIKKHICDLGTVFYNIESLSIEFPELSDYRDNIVATKAFYYRIWMKNIEYSKMDDFDKQKCMKLLNEKLCCGESDDNLPKIKNNELTIFNVKTKIVQDGYESAKEMIASPECECVSFDVFDTAILRPLLDPTDLFTLMGDKFNENYLNSDVVNFSQLRQRCEQDARNKNNGSQDIKLLQIYDEMGKYGISNEVVSEMMNLEISLEIELSQQRHAVKELYDLALFLRKKIIFISDMYLPTEVIKTILAKNGYTKYDGVFVSGEIGKTKYTGDLFRYAINSLNISPQSMVHFGDNEFSDKLMAEKSGLLAVYLPKPADMIKSREVNGVYTGNIVEDIFYRQPLTWNKENALTFTSIRCVLGLVANRIFDNPFINIAEGTTFNASPYNIGYFALGTYLLSITKWLIEHLGSQHKKIHFIARDGKILKEYYDLLRKKFNQLPESNYLIVSRKALAPLMIKQASDIERMKEIVPICNASPEQIVKLLKDIIDPKLVENAEEICKREKIVYKKRFNNESEFVYFSKLFCKCFYDERRVEQYRKRMQIYFKSIVGPNECTFDVGYSGRTESILSDLLGYPIDAYYININSEGALHKAEKFGFQITTFHDATYSVAGAMRELLLSEVGSSCIGYVLSDSEKVYPLFEEQHTRFMHCFTVDTMQNAAIDFLYDVAKLIDISPFTMMNFRKDDMTLPFEYFLNMSQQFDKMPFSMIEFEDELSSDGVNLIDFWNLQSRSRCLEVKRENEWQENEADRYFRSLPRWKRVLLFLFFDREGASKKIKEKIKGKLL